MGARERLPVGRRRRGRGAGGHLEVLKWARVNGCRWDWWTCYYAAEGGHLDVLKWARESGCAWTGSTRRFAALKGYVET